MRGSMFIRMYNNIKTVLPSVQNRDHRFSHARYMYTGATLSYARSAPDYIATKPPSSASACPVTKDDASEQSQTAASPISLA